MSKRRLGVLISGRGSNLQALIDACGKLDFPAEIALVLSNRPDALGIERAKHVGVATAILDHRTFKDREAFERAATDALDAAQVDYVCLAGFMRLLTPWFVEHWRDRLINIHPSLLPLFKGVDTHAEALAAGVKVHGCTVHFVRAEMDAGPIIGQAAVPVLPGDDPAILAARVLAAEHVLYPACVRALCEDRVQVEGDICIVDGAPTQGSLVNPAS